MKRPLQVLSVLLLLATVTSWWAHRGTARTSGPLTQHVYVWQRDWSPAIREAVAKLDPRLGPPIVLAAQVDWQGTAPQVIRVKIDGVPCGVALRISSIDPATVDPAVIANIVKSLCTGSPSELQIDFDCAESKLAGYRAWLVAIRDAVKPTPVSFTALPAWLDQPAFRELAAIAPFVLQVHAVRAPSKTVQDWQIIDPAAARNAVDRAGRIGQPFRVALPTYGSAVVLDKQGRFVRVFSENFPGVDPSQFTVRWLHTDPTAMLELVQGWTADLPATMTGVIWYRLPVAGDQLNWRPATFAAVIAGRKPAANVTPAIDRKGGLAEVWDPLESTCRHASLSIL